MSDGCYPGVDLVPRNLTSFARLCALSDLDLDLPCMDQVVAGYTKTTRGYLLYRAVSRIAVLIVRKTVRVFPALACIATTAKSIHRDGQRLVRLFTD